MYYISAALFTSDVFPGTVANSAPYQFFADSNLTLYQDLKTYMETQNTLVDDSKEGLNKVRKSEAVNLLCSQPLKLIFCRSFQHFFICKFCKQFLAKIPRVFAGHLENH